MSILCVYVCVWVVGWCVGGGILPTPPLYKLTILLHGIRAMLADTSFEAVSLFDNFLGPGTRIIYSLQNIQEA